jgi:prepilin peptidase CpaA
LKLDFPMAHDASYSGSAVFQIALLTLGAVLLILAAWHDVAARIIPNWVCIGVAGLGIVMRATQGQLIGGFVLGAAVFAVAAFCWTRGWMGGGDVKLLAATAIFISPSHFGDLLLSISMGGGIIALVYIFSRFLLRRRPMSPRPRRLLARILRVEHWRLLRGGSLPYATAIAAGTLFVIVRG